MQLGGITLIRIRQRNLVGDRQIQGKCRHKTEAQCEDQNSPHFGLHDVTCTMSLCGMRVAAAGDHPNRAPTLSQPSNRGWTFVFRALTDSMRSG